MKESPAKWGYYHQKEGLVEDSSLNSDTQWMQWCLVKVEGHSHRRVAKWKKRGNQRGKQVSGCWVYFKGVLKSSKDVFGKICNRLWQKVEIVH